MVNDPLRQVFSRQPLPEPSEADWLTLRVRLESAGINRRPFHAHRRHFLRWGLIAASLLLTTGTLWIASGSDSDSSWSQVHAAAQWGTGNADPAWVAMEITSP